MMASVRKYDRKRILTIIITVFLAFCVTSMAVTKIVYDTIFSRYDEFAPVPRELEQMVEQRQICRFASGENELTNFAGECSEVGMYLAMARVAHREGYPEIGLYWEKAAYEEAEHAAKFAELLGEVLTDSTKKNLEMRVDAENGATEGKFELAKRAKELGLDAIHDTVHEMARDEARHGKAFEGLLKRYFG